MPTENLGLQLSVLKPSDWIYRQFTPLKVGSQNEYGDWEQYLPDPEYQYSDVNGQAFDRYDCVTRSILDCLETLYCYQTGFKGNWSDRFIAKLSGTTKDGNSIEKVIDTIIKYGLIAESLWANSTISFEDYYKDIPQEIINEGQEFLSQYSVYREWVNPVQADMVKALSEAPIASIVKFASGDGILYPTGNYNHLITIYGYELGKFWKIFDHYTQTKKMYHWAYPFGTTVKMSLIKKSMNNFIPQDNILYQLVQGDGGFAMGLDGKLIVDDTAKIIASFMVRNDGAINGKTKALTLEEWNSCEHTDLKGNKIN